jgi:hypothetical protein
MSMKKSSLTSADKRYFEFVERTAKTVANWPSWMRGSTVEDTKGTSSERGTSPKESPEATKTKNRR